MPEPDKEFDLSNYIIRFESLFLVPEIAVNFYEFLKTEFNTDNWDFITSLQMLNKLCQKKNTKKIITHVQLICNTFIVEKAPKEIHIAKAHKEEILKQISLLDKKSWNLKVSPNQLFETLEKRILMEYKNDAFKRFIRTPEALKIIEKHKNSRHVLTPLISQVYNYKDEDFQDKPLNEKDLEFLNFLQTDNANWQMILSNKKGNQTGFSSISNYFPSLTFASSNLACGKNEMFFDFPLEAVALAVYSNYHKKNPFITGVKVDEYKHGAHALIEESIQFAFFSEPRVKKSYFSIHYDVELKKLTMVSKPCQLKNVPFIELQETEVVQKNGTKKMKAVQYFALTETVLTQVDENRTFVQMINMTDFGGKKLDVNAIAVKFYEHMQMGIEKMLKSMNKNEKISSHKYALNELWEGLPVDPIGKLLMDLDIESIDKAHQEKMEKRKQVFNISNFILHFSALKTKEISEKYYEFLKKEHNTDSWDFILDVNKLKVAFEKNRPKETQIQLLEKILKTYIHENSPKDLTIEKELKTKLLSRLETRMTGYPLFKYFDQIYQKIKLEHQFDSFKRFGISNEARDILAKYQHDVEVMTPIAGLLSSYKDEDFKSESISKEDLKFVMSISKQCNTWDSLFTNKEMKISHSKVNWFPEVKFIDSVFSFEYEFNFNFPMEQVANGYLTLSKMNKIDPNISKSKTIAFKEDAAIVEFEMVWDWTKPLKRKNVCSFIYEGSNSVSFIGKPLMEDWNDKTKYFQYEIVNLTSRGNQTKFQQIISVHSKESIDWNKFALERGKAFYFPLLESITKAPKTIESCSEFYCMKGENDLPKDGLAKLLTTIEIKNRFSGSFHLSSFDQTEDVSETSFVDYSEDDELTEMDDDFE
jgi:hypothetical protein